MSTNGWSKTIRRKMMKKRLFIVLIALSMVATLSFGAATTVNAQAGQVLEAKSQDPDADKILQSMSGYQGDRHET
jgi:uncharacterized BrkB/YihY/UPF0761 family membrane protein